MDLPEAGLDMTNDDSKWERLRSWPAWHMVALAFGVALAAAVGSLSVLGLTGLNVINLNALLPLEHDRIAGASIVATAFGTVLLATATVLLYLATDQLSRSTRLSIATDAPLIAFGLTLDDPPTPESRQGPPPDYRLTASYRQDHDPTYRPEFLQDDVDKAVWKPGDPIQYIWLKLQNVQTRPYAAARTIHAQLVLEYGGASDAEDYSGEPIIREIPVPVLPAKAPYATPVFNVGGFGRFRVQIALLGYRDLHSDLVRRGGYGTGYLARGVRGDVQQIDIVSRPAKKEVPA